MSLWLTTVITVISNKTKIDILIGKINPWTSEAKTHGKAYKHLKVNLDFINSGEKKWRKGGRWYALMLLAQRRVRIIVENAKISNVSKGKKYIYTEYIIQGLVQNQ